MQAERVKNFMNYQIMDQMKEYEPEFDQMLFYLPLSVDLLLKKFITMNYWEELYRSLYQQMILIVPFTATSLDDAESIIHRLSRLSGNDLRKQQGCMDFILRS